MQQECDRRTARLVDGASVRCTASTPNMGQSCSTAGRALGPFLLPFSHLPAQHHFLLRRALLDKPLPFTTPLPLMHPFVRAPLVDAICSGGNSTLDPKTFLCNPTAALLLLGGMPEGTGSVSFWYRSGMLLFLDSCTGVTAILMIIVDLDHAGGPS